MRQGFVLKKPKMENGFATVLNFHFRIAVTFLLWLCQKEAIFKFQNKNSFRPSEIETEKFFSCVKNFEIKNEKYILAVAADNEDNVKIFENIDVF